MFRAQAVMEPAWAGAVEAGTPGGAWPVALLGHDLALPETSTGRSGRLAMRLRQWRELAGHHVVRADLVHDLAEDIGSLRWFRGLGTMTGLMAVALAFWPDFSAVEAAPSVRLGVSQRDEFRSQMILPLAMGGESGRRMGPTARMVPISAAPERATIRLIATLAQGDGFARMLQRAGASAADAAQAASLASRAVALGSVAPGTRFDVTLGARPSAMAPRRLDRVAFRARFDLDLTLSRQTGGLAMTTRALPVDTTPLRIRGVVGPSLYRSARAAGAPIAAIEQYLRTLDAHLSLDSDIQPDDRFDMVVTYRRAAGGEVQVGDLLYAGLERGARPLAQLMRWGEEGRFYEASGINASSAVPRASMFMPVAGRITSEYGMRRHPVLGYSRLHAGVDFGAAWGSPIFAVSDAVVSFAGRHGGHGNYVRLEHGDGMGSGYGHMSRIAVSPGLRVRAGQVIGYVGSTGLSTGPHLHYEVYQAGRTINPLGVRFAARPAAIDQKQLAAFKARMAALKAVKPGAALAAFGTSKARFGPTPDV